MLYDPRWNDSSQRWRKVLYDSANLIEERGWTQGAFFDDRGFCISGAINHITKDKVLRHKAETRLHEMLGGPWITAWNDVLNRTKPQVLAVMRAAARL